MKLKFEYLKRDGATITGRIEETIFEEGEYRGDEEEYFSKDKKFSISSWDFPEIQEDALCVWGKYKEEDNIKISYTYDTEEEAIQVMKYLREFEVKEESHTINTGFDCVKQKEIERLGSFGYPSSSELRYKVNEIIDAINEINKTFKHSHYQTSSR